MTRQTEKLPHLFKAVVTMLVS